MSAPTPPDPGPDPDTPAQPDPKPEPGAGASSHGVSQAGLVGSIRSHPWIALIMFVCTAGGAAMGPAIMDEAWPLARQIAAGAFLGAWVGITITVTKMIG